MHTITSFTHRLIFFFSLWSNLQNRSGLIATRQGAKNNLILFFFSPFFFFPLLFCDCFFNGFIHSFLHRWKSICHSPFLFLSLFLPLSLSVSHSLSTWFQALTYLQNVIVISLLPFSFAYNDSVRQIFIERRPLNAPSYGYRLQDNSNN